MLIENMKMAFTALRANKMRSFLTMLGIITVSYTHLTLPTTSRV